MDSLARTKDVAAQWVARRDSERWSQSDEADLEAWLNASTGNRIAFLRLQAAWEDANRLKVLGAGVKAGVVPSSEHWNTSPFFKHIARSEGALPEARHAFAPRGDHNVIPKVTAWALAASALVIAVLLAWNRGYFEGNAYSTPVGGLAAVPLPDGSKVTLNTDSEIRVAVTDKERRIELKQGEAFFEVAPEVSRPFVVNAGDKRVIAVGTRFSVRKNATDIRVVVTEGTVRVEQESDSADTAVTQLSAGSVARARDAHVAVQERSVPEVEELLSWRTGFLVFHETSLAEAVEEFNRYNTRKIVIEDPAVAGLRISGNLRATNVDAFAQLLEDGFPVTVQRHVDRISLSAAHSN